MIVNKSVELLGKTVKDIITGCTGIVTSVAFDLYGCIQVVITPTKMDKDGKEIPAVGWLDVNRIKVVKNKLIMDYPDFNIKYNSFSKVSGPANKPLP